MRVMLVDDSPETLEVLVAQYQLQDEVEVVGAFSEGASLLLALAQSAPVDLVSVDIQLGAEDGLALCERVRSRYPMTHVVMCSIEADEEMRRRALRAGASHLLAKPVLSRELKSWLDVMFRPSLAGEGRVQSGEVLSEHELQEASRSPQSVREIVAWLDSLRPDVV